MVKAENLDLDLVPVHILVEHPLPKEIAMGRGRKPGSKNKAATVKGDTYVVTMGEGGPGMNRITVDPVGTALGLISPEMPLGNITARKMDKVFTLETKMVPKSEAETYTLPDIVVLQPASADGKTPEVKGKLNEVLGQLDKTSKFYGVGDEVFGFTMQLVEEKAKKSKAGRPRKVKDAAPMETTAASAAV